MKLAADFRYTAREALRGKWGVAVIAGMIASLLGAITSARFNIDTDTPTGLNLHFDLGGRGATIDVGGQQLPLAEEIFSPQFLTMLMGAASVILAAAFVAVVISLAVGSVIELGYARFNLDLVDRQKQPELKTLFDYFSVWRTAFCAKFLRGLYIFLWSLLFIIPGVVAEYSYAMTGFILAEHPELTATEAIEKSKELMYGNRWRLFCLRFSFIGWSILSAMTFGIGDLWLTPYRQAADAAFYREITGSAYIVDSPVNETN